MKHPTLTTRQRNRRTRDWERGPFDPTCMSYKTLIAGSEADRHHWKWERMKEAELLEKTYRALGHTAIADGWGREAARYREMIKPKDRP